MSEPWRLRQGEFEGQKKLLANAS